MNKYEKPLKKIIGYLQDRDYYIGTDMKKYCDNLQNLVQKYDKILELYKFAYDHEQILYELEKIIKEDINE